MEFSYEVEIARRNTLNLWLRYTQNDLQKSIREKRIGYSHALVSSISGRLNEILSGDSTLEIEFNQSGRFVDMGVGKGWKLEDQRENRLVYQAAGLHARRPKKWLSKTVYTQISALKYVLQERYGEDAANIINEVLSQKILMNL